MVIKLIDLPVLFIFYQVIADHLMPGISFASGGDAVSVYEDILELIALIDEISVS